MLLLIHHQNKVVAVKNGEKLLPVVQPQNIAKQLFVLAKNFPNELLLWCEESQKNKLNVAEIQNLFHHKKLIHSFGNTSYLGNSMGYVEESPFIKINPKVAYPSWQLCSMVGGVHASVLNAVSHKIPTDTNFDYFLNSLGKLVMPLGVFCYNNPNLLKEIPEENIKTASNYTLFRFVKQHYKKRWVFLLFLNLIYYKKTFPFLALLSSFFYQKRNLDSNTFKTIAIQSTKTIDSKSLDIVIPTIGRTKYVKAVINDLAKQTHLPKKVIIIEQNPDAESKSELAFELNKDWPFEIKHIFTHKTGACQARNLGLSFVTSDWVFLADDDNVLKSDLIQNIFHKIETLGVDLVTTSYLQKNEKRVSNEVVQWHTFGAGNSFVKKSKVNSLQFDQAMEHGYGEDADFGMQLRNKGVDVIYLPELTILHLKAPVGGFRTKPVMPWRQEKIQPKPSPTIMLFHLKHRTLEQIQGYKTILFFKYFKKQSIKNPFRYFSVFKRQWNQSVFWANQLRNHSKQRF